MGETIYLTEGEPIYGRFRELLSQINFKPRYKDDYEATKHFGVNWYESGLRVGFFVGMAPFPMSPDPEPLLIVKPRFDMRRFCG